MNISKIWKRLGLACTLAVACVAGRAQTEWEQVYTPANAQCREALEVPGNGYFMAGAINGSNSMLLQMTDYLGAVTWTNHLALNGARAIAATLAADGGLVVLAENHQDSTGVHNLVLKLNSGGLLQWQRVIPNGALSNGFRDIITAADGSFFLAGDTRDSISGLQDVRLLQLDTQGNPLWSQVFGFSGTHEQVARLVQMANGDIGIGGVRLSGNDANLFLARINLEGNLVWLQEYEKPGYQLAFDLHRSNDDGMLLLADNYQSLPTEVSVLKVDNDGNEVWERRFYPGTWLLPNAPSTYIVNSMAKDAADNVYIPVLDGVSNQVLSLVKIDPIGDSLWQQPLPTAYLPWSIVHTSDNRFLIGGESLFGDAALIKLGIEGDGATNAIRGSVYWDLNEDCLPGSSEPAPHRMLAEARSSGGAVYSRLVNSAGNYHIPVTDGDYSVIIRPYGNLPALWTVCDTPTVSVSGPNQVIDLAPTGMQSLTECPYLSVQVGAGRLRSCREVNYAIQYCNYGTATATEVYMEVLADPMLVYESSSVPLSSQNGNLYTFELADLAPGACATLNVWFYVECAAEVGDVLCVEAHIYPDSACFPPEAQWDGSNLVVDGACNGEVSFTVVNDGDPMAGSVDFVIIEDQVIYMNGDLQLSAGEDSVITIPNPAGHSYYLRTEQRPGHPQFNRPTAVVENCGGNGGSNLSLQLPTGDEMPWLDTYCDAVVGSYDPNDKRGFPAGWLDAYYLERGEPIEYMIRFQNTGNDTAFLVVIRDTLDVTVLDPASVRPGPASHPYHFDLSDGVLTFTFNNILLPDSTTNEPASNGFVLFSVAQQPDLPDGTLIENDAAIYFDFNAPVITNTWWYTIGRPLLTFTQDPPSPAPLGLRIWPNPVADQARLEAEAIAPGTPMLFTLFTADGRPVRQTTFEGSGLTFRRGALQSGQYLFRLESADGRFATGKLLIQ